MNGRSFVRRRQAYTGEQAMAAADMPQKDNEGAFIMQKRGEKSRLNENLNVFLKFALDIRCVKCYLMYRN